MSVVVGIDVGANKHAAAVCRAGERDAEKRILRYEATRRGFQELDAWLERQGEVERVVAESSGHYWWPLASHLHRRGVSVAVVNPLEAKYFAKSRLQRSKSDPADARTLAALGMREQAPTREPLLGAEVREAARFCMRLVRDQANVCQRLLRLVEIGFPEPKEAFEDPTCDNRAGGAAASADGSRGGSAAAEHAGAGGEAWRSPGSGSQSGQPHPRVSPGHHCSTRAGRADGVRGRVTH